MARAYSDEELDNLEKFKGIFVLALSETLVDDIVEAPEAAFQLYGSFFNDMIYLEIKQQVLGQGPFKCPAAQYPRNWIEAVRERFAPGWFKERWPVKYTKVYFNARVVYPKIRYPDEEFAVTAQLRMEEE